MSPPPPQSTSNNKNKEILLFSQKYNYFLFGKMPSAFWNGFFYINQKRKEFLA
jgi:hypothetical protein